MKLYKQVYGDTGEHYFDFETGFAMFLIPRLVYYGAEECFDFMITPDDEITLDELYGRETVFEKNNEIKFCWEGMTDINLSGFNMFFKYIFTNDCATPQEVIMLMKHCGYYRKNYGAPQWKQFIDKIVQETVER